MGNKELGSLHIVSSFMHNSNVLQVFFQRICTVAPKNRNSNQCVLKPEVGVLGRTAELLTHLTAVCHMRIQKYL